MRTHIAVAVLLLLGSCGPSPASQQQRAVAALTQRLAPLQRAYFADHGVYAPDARTLLGDSTTVDDIQVLLDGDASGWHASAFVPALVPASCITSVGAPRTKRVLRGGLSVRRPGDVVCIDFAEWQRHSRVLEVVYDSAGGTVDPATRRRLP